MKKSIKYVLVLCMLVIMVVPSMASAGERPCYGNLGQAGLKINVEQLESLCSKNNVSNLKNSFDLQMLKNTCSKLTVVQNGTNWTFTKPTAPAEPSAPDTQEEPAAPVTPNVPEEPKAPANPSTPKAPEEPKTPSTPQEPSKPDNNSNPTGSYESQVADLVNKERAAQGLPALKFNTALSRVAEAKAADLRDNNYFAHTSPTYGSPFDMMKSFGISYTAAGENIAKGYRSPAAVMDGWMNSSGHRANILNSNFTEIGVGYVTDSNGTGYWVQMFIRP